MNKFLLLGLAMVITVIGEFLLKHGVTHSTLQPNINSIFKTLFSPHIFVGFICFGTGAILWLFVLQRFPLSIAYPTLALNYVVVVIASKYLFQEEITAYKLTGILFIFIGVYFLYRS